MKKVLIMLMASLLLAIGTAASDSETLRYDFDSMDGISFMRADGEIDDGILVIQPNTPTSSGAYDHGFFLEGLDFDASEYDTFKIRMKRDKLDNVDPTKSRPEWLQIYFLTEGNTSFTGDRGVSVNLKTTIGEEKLSDWFEVEAKLSDNALWKGTIPRMRIDTTDNNGVYYIDYIELSNSSKTTAVEKEDVAQAEEDVTDVEEEPAVVKGSFEKVNTYENNFTDVKDTNWFSENVKCAYELGFMNGKSEGKFDPNGNVTVAEGITMASRLHAIYNGKDVSAETAPGANTLRFDFDTLDGISPSLATLEVQDGILVLKPTTLNKYGSYDAGFFIENLDFYASSYDTIKVRMKRDKLDNADPTKSRPEWLQIYFQTINDLSFNGERSAQVNLKTVIGEDKLSDWFEVEAKLSDNELWKDTISKMRIDPTDNNGVYYIDYVEFSKSEETSANSKWYDMYVSYALANNIIEKGTYKNEDFGRNITRAEMCYLFAAALPEEYFTPINNVTAIPDMDKNDYYADVMLLLYRAGVVLGSDAEGNFNAESDIKRSEVAAIIGRVALPENRVKGEITADWDSMYHIHDLEFDNPEDISKLFISDTSARGEIKNGHLNLYTIERQTAPKYDPQVGMRNISIRADEYTTLKIRMKMDFEGEIKNMKGEFFFLPEGVENFSEENIFLPNFDTSYHIDAAGWRVYTFYLGEVEKWKGNITGFRFDPTNNNGTFVIDYIRFIRDESTMIISDEELEKNYVSRRTFVDEGFENGFVVKETAGNRQAIGTWTYGEEGKEPKWNILPWWTSDNFILDGEDKYTIEDSIGAKFVTYDPEEKTVRMRLNTDKIYNGKAHVSGEMWPHLLVEQELYGEDYSNVPEDKKEVLDLGADKVYVEMEVKLHDIADLDAQNRADGVRSHIKYNVYFYVAHKDIPGLHTYLGVNPFDSRGLTSEKYDWFKDEVSIQMIYRVPCADFINEENTLVNADGTYNIGEWKKVRVDITSHLENIANLLTKDNTLKRTVTRDDFWISGVNAGFEIWGNYQCEVEMRNLNIVCYDKAE